MKKKLDTQQSSRIKMVTSSKSEFTIVHRVVGKTGGEWRRVRVVIVIVIIINRNEIKSRVLGTITPPCIIW